ncbi:hypothetical protein EUGRSUZ_H00195 [Eucalyptus grandis]|uniref:Uncharacterized protein n=2 Tax=Eucalyptus grandis TaxID=71139 RepID=A0ACC3JLE2_EUCGR|nr:hypothetical protein EUGRSUZ_H00195 [Eucalyptus grandis]
MIVHRYLARITTSSMRLITSQCSLFNFQNIPLNIILGLNTSFINQNYDPDDFKVLMTHKERRHTSR